jgi:hypothetical protein
VKEALKKHNLWSQVEKVPYLDFTWGNFEVHQQFSVLQKDKTNVQWQILIAKFRFPSAGLGSL